MQREGMTRHTPRGADYGWGEESESKTKNKQKGKLEKKVFKIYFCVFHPVFPVSFFEVCSLAGGLKAEAPLNFPLLHAFPLLLEAQTQMRQTAPSLWQGLEQKARPPGITGHLPPTLHMMAQTWSFAIFPFFPHQPLQFLDLASIMAHKTLSGTSAPSVLTSLSPRLVSSQHP